MVHFCVFHQQDAVFPVCFSSNKPVFVLNLSKPSCLDFTVVSAAPILSARFLSILGCVLAAFAILHKPDGLTTGPGKGLPCPGHRSEKRLRRRQPANQQGARKARMAGHRELARARGRPCSSQPAHAQKHRHRSRLLLGTFSRTGVGLSAAAPDQAGGFLRGQTAPGAVLPELLSRSEWKESCRVPQRNGRGRREGPLQRWGTGTCRQCERRLGGVLCRSRLRAGGPSRELWRPREFPAAEVRRYGGARWRADSHCKGAPASLACPRGPRVESASSVTAGLSPSMPPARRPSPSFSSAAAVRRSG